MKAETVESGKIIFTLQIPNGLNKKLVADAQKEKRSRHAHIVYLLEQMFEAAPNGKKEKTK